MADPQVHLSKTLAFVLRHKPESVGVVLDSGGWVELEVLVDALVADGHDINRATIEQVVANSDKRRYEIAGERIRAAQGHSIPVDLGLSPAAPPPILFHGTVERFLPAIVKEGLLPMSRQQVHLSANRDTATTVGARRGVPVVIVVDAARMQADGYTFFVSSNDVWLADTVPPEYLVM